MYDVQRIGKIVADTEKYLNELESYKISSVSDLLDGKTYNASSMVVFAVLNRVIDLGNEIISAEKLGAPNTYQDIMPVLAKAGVINKEQSSALNGIIRKRNVLAHFYDDMDAKELFRTIKDMHIIKNFLSAIKKRITSNKFLA